MYKCLLSLRLHHVYHGPAGQRLSHGQSQSQSGKRLYKDIIAGQDGLLGTTEVPVHHR